MSEKILLVDGHSIINRAFYGVTNLTNSQGLHTNAIFGFLNTLFKVLEEEKPDYITVAFDVKAPTFRHEMYAEYKGTRKPMPEELHEQVPVLKNLLHAMGIPTMVILHKMPESVQTSPCHNPPHKNHIKFPRQLINSLPLFPVSGSLFRHCLSATWKTIPILCLTRFSPPDFRRHPGAESPLSPQTRWWSL